VPTSQHPSVSVSACPAGPLLVRGDVTVVGEDGSVVPSHRRTLAFCRCGASQIQPMCDGSHRALAQNRPASG
jgi:CDGSH-type Zn-finger protein